VAERSLSRKRSRRVDRAVRDRATARKASRWL
jgi:hypothetical protein